MNKIIILTGLFLIFAASASAQIAAGGSYTLNQSVISGGGGTSTDAGGNYSLTGTLGQAVAGTNSTASPFAVRGGFHTPENFAPTAAEATIEGRVRTESGKGIRNVRITLTTSDGAVRTVLSGAFGDYRFAGIAAGQTVILTAAGKRFVFSEPTQILNLDEDMSEIDFIGFEQWFREQQ